MSDVAVSTLSDEESRLVWDRFDESFDFKPSMHAFPAIREPVPSITWSLQALDDDAGCQKLDSLVTLVIDALIACVPPRGSLLLLEWQHVSYRLRPDYPVLIAEDFSYGSFGHPWERSICLFGAPLLDVVADGVGRLLPSVLRQDGRPAAKG